MKVSTMASMIVTDSHDLPCKGFRNTSQMASTPAGKERPLGTPAEKLTVSRDNSLERTPTSIEADMNS
jgi:hypothetical protein